MEARWYPLSFDLQPGQRAKLLTKDGKIYGTDKDYIGTITGPPSGRHGEILSYPISWDWSEYDNGHTPVIGTVPINYDPFWKVECYCGAIATRDDYLCESCRHG